MRIHRWLAPPLVALALLGTLSTFGVAACNRPVTIVTPQGKAAYTADQVVLRVNELENAAIQANSTGALTVATTKTIVEFAVSADYILKQTPAGWQATVATSWGLAKAKVTTANPAILAAMAAVDLVLGVTQ